MTNNQITITKEETIANDQIPMAKGEYRHIPCHFSFGYCDLIIILYLVIVIWCLVIVFHS
jgi:hypothetical protein